MKNIFSVFAVAFALFGLSAQAIETPSSAKATPLGFTIGESTLGQVVALFQAKQIDLQLPATGVYSGLPGPCQNPLEVFREADKLGLPGMHSVLFCFDEENKVNRITMNTDAPADKILDDLSSKYELLEKQELQGKTGPYIAGAVFKKGTVTIQFLYDASRNPSRFDRYGSISLNYVSPKVVEAQEEARKSWEAALESRRKARKAIGGY